MCPQSSAGRDRLTLQDALRNPTRNDPFLITLLYKLRSEPIPGGMQLIVDVSDEAPALVDSDGKRSLFAATESMDRRPIEEWAQLAAAGKQAEYNNPQLPLRWASGGVLAIIVHRGIDYFAIGFRNIFPKGWNLFVGASGSWVDLIDVERTAEREFREELLICDKTSNIMYHFNMPGQCFDSTAFQDEALARWRLSGCTNQPLECEIIRGPDSVTVEPRRDGKALPHRTTDGLFVVIDPRVLGIECMRIVRIPLPDAVDLERDVVFLDGELRGAGLLDSAIGLLDVAQYTRWEEGGCEGDLPFSHIYQGGNRLSHGMAESEQIKQVWEHRNDLCPVTAEMIATARAKEYTRWLH